MSLLADFLVNVVGAAKRNAGAAPAGSAPPAASADARADSEEQGDGASGGQENQLQLLFEQKTLQDKLNEPRSYPGRDKDEARLEEVRRKLGEAASPVNQSTMPPPKDPRVAELHRQSIKELSDEMDPDTTHLVDRKKIGPTIEEYYAIRHELQDNWVNNINPQIHTSKDITEAGMKAWAKAIADLIEHRRLLATNIVYQLGTAIEAEQKQLLSMNADLTNHIGKLKRVMAEVERVERIMGALKWALRLKDLGDLLDAFTFQVDKVGKLAATAGKIASDKAFDIILDMSGKIEAGINGLKDYSLQQTIAYEGYASLGELLQAIQQRKQTVNDKKTLIAHLARRRERAQTIYDTK